MSIIDKLDKKISDKKIKKDFYIKETENNNQNKKDSSSKSLLKKLLKW